jgi:hypothetical protein
MEEGYKSTKIQQVGTCVKWVHFTQVEINGSPMVLQDKWIHKETRTTEENLERKQSMAPPTNHKQSQTKNHSQITQLLPLHHVS